MPHGLTHIQERRRCQSPAAALATALPLTDRQHRLLLRQHQGALVATHAASSPLPYLLPGNLRAPQQACAIKPPHPQNQMGRDPLCHVGPNSSPQSHSYVSGARAKLFSECQHTAVSACLSVCLPMPLITSNKLQTPSSLSQGPLEFTSETT